jgi:predicted heme/steroid binding protein
MAIGREELAQHGASSDAPWVALFGTVFDVSSFLSLHPGGRKILADACGSDATSAFMAVHSAETLEKLADQLVSVGELEHSSEETLPERGSEGASMKASGPALAATVESGVTALEVHLHLPDAIASMTTEQLSALTGSLAHTATRASLPESAAQHEIAEGATSAVARPPLDDKPDGAPNLHAALLAGSSSTNASSDGGRAWQGVPQRGDPAASPPEDRTFVLPTDQLHALKNLREIEEAAYSRLPYTSRAMIEHGSEDDETVSNNTGAWSRYALVPRVLRDVNGVDTSAMVLGHRVALPVLAGPASFHDRVHPSGEIAVARGVSQVGGGAVIQGRASQPLPLIIEAAAGAPCFFQLYTAMDVDGATMDRTYVRKVLEHAASLGFLGVFVTVDTPNTGNREKTFGSPQWSVSRRTTSAIPIFC